MKKTSKNPVINFSLAAVFCEVFSSQAHPLFSWFWLGLAVLEEEFAKKKEKGALASIFPAQHKKARITKVLHICQRFGVQEKEGERKSKKMALYYIF